MYCIARTDRTHRGPRPASPGKGPLPFLPTPRRAPAQHTEHHHTWLSIFRVAVPKDTGWQHVRQETGDRCCAIRRTHIAHDEEDGRGRRGTMLNIEHADEDKDKCSTHAIFIADLRESKPQGEREALEKDKVGMCQPAQRKRSMRQTNDQEVATAASTWQDRKSIPSA